MIILRRRQDTRLDIPKDGLVFNVSLYKHDGAAFLSDDTYGHLCTVIGAPWTPQGRSFDAVDDYIRVPDAPSLCPTAGITIIAWILRTGVAATQVFVYKEQPGTTKKGYQLLIDSSNYLIFDTGDGTNRQRSAVLVSGYTGAFAQYVGTWNGTTQTIYKNAVEVGTPLSWSGSIAYTAARDVLIGTEGSSFSTKIIGEVQISTRGMTPSEVMQNYLATKWRYN